MGGALPVLIPTIGTVLVAAIGAAVAVVNKRAAERDRLSEELIAVLRERLALAVEERDEARRQVAGLERIVSERRPTRKAHPA